MTQTHARVQTIIWTGVAFLTLWLLWVLSPILTPFVIAAVFAYLCDPAVNALTRRRLPRVVAVSLVIILTGLILVALALILLPVLYREAMLLVERLPGLVGIVNNRLLPWLAERFDIHAAPFDAALLQSLIAKYAGNAQQLTPVLLAHIGNSSRVIITLIANLFLIPVVAFYLLLEWPRLINAVKLAWPRPWLPRTQQIVGEIDALLAQFCRGQGSVMLLLAIYYSIGLSIAGIQFALPVGVMTGLLVFIPYAGFGGGLLLALLTAILQADGGWGPIIGVSIVYGIGQLVESFLLTPYLVGERIGLHPLAVIFALMAFGQLFGFVGVLIALPVSAALVVGAREIASAWFSSAVYLGDALPLTQPVTKETP